MPSTSGGMLVGVQKLTREYSNTRKPSPEAAEDQSATSADGGETVAIAVPSECGGHRAFSSPE